MSVSVVVGNPKPGSRTLTVASDLGSRLASWASTDMIAMDLASVADRMFDWEDSTVAAMVSQLQSSALAVIASPTFKASYTGLLKAFLDRIPTNGLHGVVAVPLMMGAAPIHYLAPEVHLRPVLIEAGASCPTRGIYVQEADLGDLDAVLGGWFDTHEAVLKRALAI
ncbi:MAG: NADPH-dependent FMN reductase [Acidimicrobiales bacterium]